MKHKVIALTLVLLFSLFLSACSKESIKIGFIGDLTSKNSQLSIDARNAVEYALNQANENGGVNGRLLELVVKDDQADTAVAIEKDQEFINEGVHFVIGHMHSNMTEAMKQSANEDLLFVSPTMGTNALSYLDDFIIRAAPLNAIQAEIFSDYYIKNDLNELVIVCDLMNKEYTETVAGRIEEILTANNTEIKAIIKYDSRKDDLKSIVDQVMNQKPNTLLLLSQATDSAYFVQGIKKVISSVSIFSVSWSMTKDFIVNGGKYAEGTKFIGVYTPKVASPAYTSFAQGYEKNYNYKPSFVSVLGADAFQVLYLGLKNAKEITPTQVKKAILETQSIEGLQETFMIDAFGDDTKSYMFFELINGEYVPKEE